MSKTKKLPSLKGRMTDLGFEVLCPDLGPADREDGELQTYDTSADLLALVNRRSGKEDARLVYRSRSGMQAFYEPELGAHFYRSMAMAYSWHLGVCLRPEVVWHLIAHEVGAYIGANKKECAHFFTSKPGEKQKLLVFIEENDSWEAVIPKFRTEFAKHVPEEVLHTFLPTFSTSDAESEAATMLTFMDSVSPWFEFGGFQIACGFPSILLAGTAQDWKLLRAHVGGLMGMFEGLRSYLQGAWSVLLTINETFDSGVVDQTFWHSMFRYQSGSGDPTMTGWLSSLVAYMATHEGKKIRTSFEWGPETNYVNMERLTDGVNYADLTVYVGDESGPKTDYTLVSGVLGSEITDERVVPRLGFAVAEVG